jgi:uncharacterized membrane protein YkvA (DUF1232 family)
MIALLRKGVASEITASSLADALQEHSQDVATEDIERLAGELEQFLHTVPDALAVALTMSRDPRCGRAVAFATGTVLAYVFDEEDLLPEASFGTLGLLDDGYLVHAFVAALRRTYPYVEAASAYSGPTDATLDTVATLLPDGVAQALLRTSESTVQVALALFPTAVENGDTGVEFHPQIRVAEAAGLFAAATTRA